MNGSRTPSSTSAKSPTVKSEASSSSPSKQQLVGSSSSPAPPPLVDVESVDFSRIVPPHNVGQLAQHLGFTLSGLFKQVGLVGVYERASYSWMSFKNCHRPKALTAGVYLSEWFHRNIVKASTCIVVDNTALLNWLNELKATIFDKTPPCAKLLHIARIFTIYPGKGKKPYKMHVTTENARKPPWIALIRVQFEFEGRPNTSPKSDIVVGEFRSAEHLVIARRFAMKDLADYVLKGQNVTLDAMRKVVTDSVANDRVLVEIASKRKSRDRRKESQKDGKPKARRNDKSSKIGGSRRTRKPESRRRRDEDRTRDSSRSGSRHRKKRDAVAMETRTEWLGEGYPGPSSKGKAQTFYTGFRFTDTREECRVLDHVLVYREVCKVCIFCMKMCEYIVREKRQIIHLLSWYRITWIPRVCRQRRMSSWRWIITWGRSRLCGKSRTPHGR